MATRSEKFVVLGRNNHLFAVFDEKDKAMEYARGCLVGVGKQFPVFVEARVFAVPYNPESPDVQDG